jgi:hypothetical protein
VTQMLPLRLAIAEVAGEAAVLAGLLLVPGVALSVTPLLPKRVCDVPLAVSLQSPCTSAARVQVGVPADGMHHAHLCTACTQRAAACLHEAVLPARCAVRLGGGVVCCVGRHAAGRCRQQRQ